MNNISAQAQAMRDLSPLARTRELMRKYDLHPVKSLGQNFLVDGNHIRHLVDVVFSSVVESAIEIGPGLGALTVPLAMQLPKLTAFEKDRKLEAPLSDLLGDLENFELRMGDFLEADLTGLSGPRVSAIGNLPYYITSPILEKLLMTTPPFGDIVITVQKEVGDRLRARAGEDDYSSLSVFCQFYVSEVSFISTLGPGAFLPPPGVSSMALRLKPRALPPEQVISADAFFRCVRAAFGHRRKTLRRALIMSPHLNVMEKIVDAQLEIAGINGQRRGETLDFEEFTALANALVTLEATE